MENYNKSFNELPIFEWCVSPGLTVNNEERILEARFGDGYSERAPDGIHTLIRTFTVNLNRSIEDAKQIMSFLRERGQIQAFQWTIPTTNETVIVRCLQWTMTVENKAIKISATFKELVGENPETMIPDLDEYPEYNNNRKNIDILTNLAFPHDDPTGYAAARKNTHNDLPSNHLADLNDDIIIIDEFTNSKEEKTVDRFGKSMPTLSKIIADLEKQHAMPQAPDDDVYVGQGKSWKRLSDYTPKQMQVDWKQEDENESDYIKNKPFVPKFTEKEDGTVSAENNYNFSGTAAFGNSIFQKTVEFKQQILLQDNGNPLSTKSYQPDWNESDENKPEYIKNKPEFKAQIQSDWEQEDNTKPDFIKNKPVTGKSGIYIGEIRMMPFRILNLPRGWVVCDGYKYFVESAIGQALERLDDDFKDDWGIVKNDEINPRISVPDLINPNGYFFRAVDGSIRQVGSKQDWAVENITGTFPSSSRKKEITATGVFTQDKFSDKNSYYGQEWPVYDNTTILDTSRMLKTDTETRPMNAGMIPAIYLGDL